MEKIFPPCLFTLVYGFSKLLFSDFRSKNLGRDFFWENDKDKKMDMIFRRIIYLFRNIYVP